MDYLPRGSFLPKSFLWTAILATVLCGGCGKPRATSQPSPKQPAPSATELAPQPATSATIDSREIWDAFYIGDAHVGYGHTVLEPITHEGEPMIQIHSRQQLSMLRFGQKIDMEMTVSSVETPAGRVARFETNTKAGPTAMVVKGTVSGDRVQVAVANGAPVERLWDDDQGGPFATEQSMERTPMKTGEKRSVKILLPILSQVHQLANELEAMGMEPTPLMAGSMNLMKIKSTVSIGGQSIITMFWVTPEGKLKKSYVAAMDQTTYHDVGEPVARGKRDAVPLELADLAVVRLAERLPDAHRANRIVYRVRMKSNDPAGTFATSAGQIVEPIDDRSARLIVGKVRPDQPADVARVTPPTSGDLAANSLIQSDDPAIIALSNEIEASGEDPWSLACALEQLVNRSIRQKNFSQAFATAADVARTREGDCTEHSVLLAAVCRARGIPTRVAVGLVYADSVHGFAFHMWNEVWIEDRWIPLDGTLGLGGTGAGHLKLDDSNLSEGEAEAAILPVIQVIGQLAISVE